MKSPLAWSVAALLLVLFVMAPDARAQSVTSPDSYIVSKIALSSTTFSPGDRIQGSFTLSSISKKTGAVGLRYAVATLSGVQKSGLYSGKHGVSDYVATSLDYGDTIQIPFTYVIPKASGDGDKAIGIIVEDTAGVRVGFGLAPVKILSSAAGARVVNASLMVNGTLYAADAGPTVGSGDAVSVVLTIANDAATAVRLTPSFSLYKRVVTGQPLVESHATTTSVAAHAKDATVRVSIPVEHDPGIYAGTLALVDEANGGTVASDLRFRYIVAGETGSITAASLAYDEKGQLFAHLTLFGTPSDIDAMGDPVPPVTGASVSVTLSQNGIPFGTARQSVGALTEQPAYADVPIEVPSGSALDSSPVAVAVSLTKGAATFDARTFTVASVPARAEHGLAAYKSPLITLGALIALALLAYFAMRLRSSKKKSYEKSIFGISIFALAVILGAHTLTTDAQTGSFITEFGMSDANYYSPHYYDQPPQASCWAYGPSDPTLTTTLNEQVGDPAIFTSDTGNGDPGYVIAPGQQFYIRGNAVTAACTNQATNAMIYRVWAPGSGGTSGQSGPADVTTGITAWWKLDESSGTTAADSSGNGHNGTLQNTAGTWVAGMSGNAVSLDGTDDKLQVSDNASVDLTGSFTISAWIYPRSLGGGNLGRILDKNYSSLGYMLYLDNSNTTSGVTFVRDNAGTVGNAVVSSANAIALNQWQHVVFTFDAATRAGKIYVNGTVVGSGTLNGSVSNNSGALVIGGRSSDNARQFNGTIDDVRLYDRTLSGAEVASVYQAASGSGSQQVATDFDEYSFDNLDIPNREQLYANGQLFYDVDNQFSFGPYTAPTDPGIYTVRVRAYSARFAMADQSCTTAETVLEYQTSGPDDGTRLMSAGEMQHFIIGWTEHDITYIVPCPDGSIPDGSGSCAPGQQQTLSLTVAGTGDGTISGGGISCSVGNTGTCSVQKPNGTVVNLTATPTSPDVFSGWGGACSGTGACSVTLDNAKNVTATFDTGGPTIDSASCSPSTVTNLSAPGDVTFTASATGGSGTYDYSWDGGVTWDTSNTDTVSYTSPGGSAPVLSVRDRVGPGVPRSASPNCGSVFVVGEINIYAGTNPQNATKNFVFLNQGRKFVLKWARSLNPSYSCTPTVAPAPDAGTDWSAWSNADFSQAGSVNLSTSVTTPPGQYVFGLNCVDTSDGSPGPAASARARVTSTLQVEI